MNKDEIIVQIVPIAGGIFSSLRAGIVILTSWGRVFVMIGDGSWRESKNLPNLNKIKK